MPALMSTDKFMKAERKNRLEVHRLGLQCRHYDKETVRFNYDIEREKRHITKAFKGVIKTSGASDLGIPPRNEKDTDYEKCPSYKQGLKLSNKRLLQWRECEKQLLKFIENHEKEREKRNRKLVLRKRETEYDVLPPKRVDELEDDVFVDNDLDSLVTSDKTSISEIIGVREDSANVNDVFDIKQWEKDVIESYKTSVCKHASSSKPVHSTHTLRSQSSQAFTNGKGQFNNSEKKVRPHTAHERSRPSSGGWSLPSRPVSAKVQIANETKFLITKESTYIKTGRSFEKLFDNRPVDKPVIVNNYLNTLTPFPHVSAEKEPSIASMSTLCPVQEGDEDDETDEATQTNNNQARSIDSNGVPEPFDDSREQPQLTSHQESLETSLKLKFQKRLKHKLLRTRSANASLQTQNQRMHFKQSNSDLSSYADGSRRSRHNSDTSSMISIPRSRTGSIVSNHRPSISLGIPADIEEISRDQDKLASGITAEKPLASNKLVSISKVVRAAMTFSRVARKRALLKMQEENSSDSHEIVRQERIRKLQSRQSVLNIIASQWSLDNKPDVKIEQVE
ncbi:uncharacterized protein LOC127853574 [Dreissena polymorpha]|uniref:Uncharacterized protein n=1 Tax=Dreissena polymorpha TaxID=45954 RepID=A0A9D4HS33_DREPO|nr:uncharacterized protein LOC127853574 [Dreissena polymorpha]XP_052244187.1 uncharacterized protein LOC127853574 [Dreissena polymorpha]KAH3728995.1 hypothetical protein DPMN_054958 [Dreissena polymorpha]